MYNILNLIPKCVKSLTLKKECADSPVQEKYLPPTLIYLSHTALLPHS